MFKKIFNAITGNDDENQNKEEEKINQRQNAAHQDDDDEEDDDEEYEDDDDDDEEYSNSNSGDYDPVTLHGKHYTPEQFDAEVEKRAQAWISKEESDFKNKKSGVSAKDFDENGKMVDAQVNNIYNNYSEEVFKEWNSCGFDSDPYIRWQMKQRENQMLENMKGNPLLEPVHGIDMRTYTAMAKKIAAGVDYKDVCKAMGLEPIIWEELNTIWPQRMTEDTTYTVTTLFGKYYAEDLSDITQLANLEPQMSDKGKETLEKMKTDPYFYEELEGARQAAYEYGIDGAQWILDNFGVNLAQFQEVAMMYMERRNAGWDSEEITDRLNYRQEKQKEYAAKFAQEQGGNVADDVEF